jgi:hypothetical protein
MRASTTILFLTLTTSGCGLFIHGATPVGGVAESNREVVSRGLNEPDKIRLTKPTKVAGIDLAAGSLVARAGSNKYLIESAGPVTVRGVALPAGSTIELEKANSIFTGDTYNWTGVAFAGGDATYHGQPVERGDRLYFAGRNPFGTPPLAQLRIARTRAVNGKDYPAGTLFDFEENGKISGAYTPATQRALSAAREQRRREREQNEKDCQARCAVVTDFHQHAVCLGHCRN